MRVGVDGTITYASPNALSAFRRLGVAGNVLGEPIDSLTTAPEPEAESFDGAALGSALDAVMSGVGRPCWNSTARVRAWRFARCQLCPRGRRWAPSCWFRTSPKCDVVIAPSLSKDATIREIHHRVKNNLQTVAALLRLQARRVSVPEARVALEESMRRVTSIALVHETLSVSIDEEVAFDDIVDRLLEMLADVMGSTGRVELRRTGTFGEIPAEAATALVLVLTELVQNAVEHAFTPGDAGHVEVSAERDRGTCRLPSRTTESGVAPGFAAETSDRLGLQIVRKPSNRRAWWRICSCNRDRMAHPVPAPWSPCSSPAATLNQLVERQVAW